MDRFFPYGRQCIDQDDIEKVVEVLKSDYLTTGPWVDEFEEEICKTTGSKYAVVVSNGTAALHLAALVLLKKGDKVLTTPNTFLATANSVVYAGGEVVFCDIKEDGNIDMEKAYGMLKNDPSIKAFFPVHFSGNPVDQDILKKIREELNIKILEDCAHSIGATFRMKDNSIVKAGSCTFSDLSILSFHPVKHITSAEGGAITTNSKEQYDRLRKLRTHGMQKEGFINKDMAFSEDGEENPWYYEMQEIGFNYRITDLQCALGISQIKKLDDFVARRREIARYYDEAFKDSPVIPLYEYNENSSYHLYVIRVKYKKNDLTRSAFMNFLREKNIGTQVHYIPVNKQPFYTKRGHGKETIPVMDKYYEECISIPMYPMLKDSDLKYISNTILSKVKI
ncbi:MAG: UDP-4-amino-4,6-dideoxy-N-acetyl-beta-L-altrosamine transaminase [Candidatus Muiribacterium halophilum]|uniref:UDP-4-amino-4, 6-dideoxy-N-acetyl-beta-L-altrosamine transaminase n=1 Tax=Muiribacterium halophilum TaxID=2053465 RepID=A0A2N5Z9T9_MUIH1|nr:MAG: UDP-4-amino-4,6-dideoxy-N-acetyl-beta-L-altrosamine transaminase [Candidatus Muirbacterium halophilum]